MDYLKKLKESLEQGTPDNDVVNHHFEILKAAEVVKKIQTDKKKDDALYDHEINEYVQNKSDIEAELTVYDEGLLEYIGEDMPKDMKEKLEIQKIANEAANKADKERKKREIIEINTLQIKLLKEEIEKLQSKITKNVELIEFLVIEMNKT